MLQSEILDLKASFSESKAKGIVVIESQIDKGKGPVSTVINYLMVTLKKGDYFICGLHDGEKLEHMINYLKVKISLKHCHLCTS